MSSADDWAPCNGAPLMINQPNVWDDKEAFDEWTLQYMYMIHQGLMDEYENYFVSAADLAEAQGPLKSNMEVSAVEDF